MIDGQRTLSTEPTDSVFRAEHDRVLARLTRAGLKSTEPIPGSLRDKYAPQVVESAISSWRARMVNEHRSSTVFAALLPQLIEASSDVAVQSVVLRMAQDEIHHAVLCGRIVRAFGGSAVAQAEAELPRMAEHRGLAPLERVMRNVMFVGCLAETVAVGLVSQERELAEEPCVRETLDQIVGDEVTHARFGWQFLGATLGTLDSAARRRTEEYLRVAFAYLERREIELLPVSAQPVDELVAQRECLGLCDGRHARELFYATVQGVIVPRFEALGLDAGNAWRRRSERAVAARDTQSQPQDVC